ncbi:hypothetical protein [Bacillus sp. JJ722]|uniref:hypothetical protein n=1 Tax=Bacillus sp. JJ722 TaxID=3122973 RepID=UPI002FFFC79D
MNTTLWLLAVLFVFILLGVSMVMMPLTTAGMNALPDSLIAHGTDVNSTLRMVGGAIITALFVTVMSSVMILKADEILAMSMLAGIRVAFGLALVLGVLGLVLSFFLKGNNRV